MPHLVLLSPAGMLVFVLLLVSLFRYTIETLKRAASGTCRRRLKESKWCIGFKGMFQSGRWLFRHGTMRFHDCCISQRLHFKSDQFFTTLGSESQSELFLGCMWSAICRGYGPVKTLERLLFLVLVFIGLVSGVSYVDCPSTGSGKACIFCELWYWGGMYNSLFLSLPVVYIPPFGREEAHPRHLQATELIIGTELRTF